MNHSSSSAPAQTPSLRAGLIGSNTCTAAGITAHGNAPVLVLCRRLLAAGLDPDQAMEVYRGATLALRVRSIGEAAELEINSKGTAFVARRAVRTARTARFPEPALADHWTDWPAATDGGAP